MEAKLYKMFKHVPHLPTQEKAYKIVENIQVCQEQLQGLRSQLWIVGKRLRDYTHKKANSEQLLTQFAAGVVDAGPKIDEAKVVIEKAEASIPKYQSYQQCFKQRIERLERSLEHHEKLLQQIRLRIPQEAQLFNTRPLVQSDTLVMNSGSQIEVQLVKIPKLKTPEVCSCCLDEVDFNCDDACTLDCLHGYHFTCVSEWLKKAGRCPSCNQPTCTLFKFSPDSQVTSSIQAVGVAELVSIDELLDGASTRCNIPSDTES